MKRILTIGLLIVLCLGLCACSSSGSSSGSKKDKRSSSDSKEKDKKEKDKTDRKDTEKNDKSDKTGEDDGAGALGDLLDGLKDKKDSDKTGGSTGKDSTSAAEVKPADTSAGSDDKKDTASSERNIVHKFYELVTVDGHTREDFQNNQELADAYALWDFYQYGTGVEVSLDYDNGYIQYSWYIISTNTYSSAPIDRPNEVDCMLDYTGYLNADDEPDWIPITISYSDDTIVQTFTEGGCVCVYKLAAR